MINLVGLTMCSGFSELTCNSTYTYVPIVLMVSGGLAAVAITAFVMVNMCCLVGVGGGNSGTRVRGTYY